MNIPNRGSDCKLSPRAGSEGQDQYPKTHTVKTLPSVAHAIVRAASTLVSAWCRSPDPYQNMSFNAICKVRGLDFPVIVPKVAVPNDVPGLFRL